MDAVLPQVVRFSLAARRTAGKTASADFGFHAKTETTMNRFLGSKIQSLGDRESSSGRAFELTHEFSDFVQIEARSGDDPSCRHECAVYHSH
ncbi:hypothetical protein MTX36_27160 [Rhodococcus sp. ARC_M6]|nr:hypothetical protein [Rhodococcus sp. ARC_M6]